MESHRIVVPERHLLLLLLLVPLLLLLLVPLLLLQRGEEIVVGLQVTPCPRTSSIVVSKTDYWSSDNYTTEHPNRKRWAVELKITSGTFSGSFHALMESDPDGRSYCVDTPEEPLVTLGGGEYYIDIEALMVMILTIQDKNSGTETITLDGDDGYDETIAFNTKNGQLFLEYDRLIEHGGFDFKVEIENPEEFLKSFYEQLLAITKTKPLDDEDEHPKDALVPSEHEE